MNRSDVRRTLAPPDSEVSRALRGDAVGSRDRRESAQLLVQPLLAVVLAVGVLLWAFHKPLTPTQQATLGSHNLLLVLGQHILITAVVVVLVIVVGVPLGTVLSRSGLRRLAPVVIGLANIGAAAPTIGLIVLCYLVTQRVGFWVAVGPIVASALLPVLRGTIVGYRQIDPALLDAGRGQGMTAFTVLRRIEFPLVVPYLLAGLRVSLILAVGTATLAFLVDGGGLGILIDTGYKLRDTVTLVVGSVLTVALALLVDWLGAVTERVLGPKDR